MQVAILGVENIYAVAAGKSWKKGMLIKHMGGIKMKKVLLAALMPLFVLFSLTSLSLAAHGHMAEEKQPAMKMASTDVVVDGLSYEMSQ